MSVSFLCAAQDGVLFVPALREEMLVTNMRCLSDETRQYTR